MSEAVPSSRTWAWDPTLCLCSLQNVSFSLSPGKVTALVGPSGSGKSSCVNILENFYPLQGGRVLLDGKPISAYDHKYLHRVVSAAGLAALGLPPTSASLMQAVTEAEKVQFKELSPVRHH